MHQKGVYTYPFPISIGNGSSGAVVDKLSFVIDQDNNLAASSPGLT